jgi:glutathione synthase/RimK-type ligase-like ATP-grasp enzyme
VAWLDGLDAVQVDPHHVRLRADDKVAQLRLARRVGLDVPATLVTNDAGRVRDFAAAHPSLVTKMLVQPGSGAEVVFTTALDAGDLDHLDGLELCPMVFQERVPAVAEVRATVVGDQVLAAIAARPPDEVDWRRAAHTGGPVPVWAPHPLPAAVADRLVALTRALGLTYGAADLLVGPDGRHTFLEINARGSFGHLGDPLADRIADAVARLLVSGGRP